MSLTENLLALFRVDSQARGLRGRLESAERYLAAQTRQVEDLERQREEMEARRRQLQAKVANLEGESALLDQRIEKLRTELNNASSNKQYSAVLGELNAIKLSRTDLDNRTLQQMEQIEQIATQLAKLAADLAERQKVRGVAAAELRQRHEDVGQRLAELDAERRSAAAVIPPRELSVFNEVANSYHGEAMASVEEIDRRHREYACGACNLSLPFEAVAALLGTSEGMTRCPACGRILYMEEKTRGALVKK